MLRPFTSSMLLLALALAPAAVHAAPRALETTPLDPRERGRLAVAPATFPEAVVDPGGSLTLELQVRNHDDEAVTARLLVLPLTGSSDPEALAAPTGSKSRSAVAAGWVDGASGAPYRIPANAQVVVPLRIVVPADARPGAYALAIGPQRRITERGVSGVEASGARVVAAASAMSRVVFTVSGDAVSKLEIGKVDSPRFVRGGSPTQFAASVTNVGDSLLDVDAQVDVDAFAWTASRTLSTDAQLVLPDGARTLRMRWPDPPLIGRFQPRLVVVGGTGSGVREELRLPTVWVVPPWWMLLSIVVAAAVPIRAARRRRRRLSR